MSTTVRMKHEGVDGTPVVSERAFLGLWQRNGWELADEQPAQPVEDEQEPTLQRPQRNDSTESWRTYAVARGLTRDHADSLSRDGDDGLIAYFDHLDQTLES